MVTVYKTVQNAQAAGEKRNGNFHKEKMEDFSSIFLILVRREDRLSNTINMRCVNKILFFEEGAPYEYCNIPAEAKADRI